MKLAANHHPAAEDQAYAEECYRGLEVSSDK